MGSESPHPPEVKNRYMALRDPGAAWCLAPVQTPSIYNTCGSSGSPGCSSSPSSTTMLFIMWAFNILHQKADKEKDTDSARRKNPSWVHVENEEYDVCNWSRNITLVIFQRLFGRKVFAGQILNVVSELKHFTTRIHYFPYVHFILQSKLYCPSAPITILLPIQHSSLFIDTPIWLHASCS